VVLCILSKLLSKRFSAWSFDRAKRRKDVFCLSERGRSWEVGSLYPLFVSTLFYQPCIPDMEACV